MKKMYILSISITILIVLSACNFNSNPTPNSAYSNITLKKDSSLQYSETSSNICENAESEFTNNESSGSINNSSRAPEWLGKQFQYYENVHPNTDLFVDWIKSGGTKEIDGKRFNEYPYSDRFFECIASKSTLIIPKPKNTARFHSVKVFSNSPVFAVTIEIPTANETLRLEIHIHVNDDYNGNLKEYADKVFNNANKEFVESQDKSPWGEYYYSTSSAPAAVIDVQGYFVSIMPYGTGYKKPWDDKYFDYFDFEIVSLKG